MKLYFIFTVCLVGTSFGNSLAQKQQVTLNLKNVSLYELFNQIKEQTGLRFLYNAEQLDGLANVSVQAQNEKVSDVLNKVFSGKALTDHCQKTGNSSADYKGENHFREGNGLPG